jgi:hypothetical protein
VARISIRQSDLAISLTQQTRFLGLLDVTCRAWSFFKSDVCPESSHAIYSRGGSLRKLACRSSRRPFAAREAHLKYIENNHPDDLTALMSMYSLISRRFLKDHCRSSALMSLAVKARKRESLFSILQTPIHEARPHSSLSSTTANCSLLNNPLTIGQTEDEAQAL